MDRTHEYWVMDSDENVIARTNSRAEAIRQAQELSSHGAICSVHINAHACAIATFEGGKLCGERP